MKPFMMSRSSVTINNIWKARGRRPTIRRTCKVFIPRDMRQLDTLRVPASYEEDNFFVQRLKTVTRHKLHHWILVAAISCYLYSGAVMFQYIEAHHGKIPPFNMSQPREFFLRELVKDHPSQSTEKEKWVEYTRSTLLSYEAKLLEASKQGYTGDTFNPTRPHWSIDQAIFYCFTVITTVGYGNVSPSSDAGRVATIIYAALGIPLMFLVLADFGKLFTKAIKFVFRYVRRLYKAGTASTEPSDSLDNSKTPLQYMTVSWRTVSRTNALHSHIKANDGDCNEVTTLTLHNDGLYKELDFMNEDETNHKHVQVEDEFNLPITLAVALVIIYMAVGALLFAVWEEWTLFQSFYFVFISMSTVGFGDYAPSNQCYMMAAFFYLVFGLTLFSMCINVIQEKLTATFQKAKVRIGNTIGLDVNTLLRDADQKSRSETTKTTSNKNNLWRKALSNGFLGNKSNPSFTEDQLNFSSCNDVKDELFLATPLQKRFTFYDSPYSTIQNDLP